MRPSLLRTRVSRVFPRAPTVLRAHTLSSRGGPLQPPCWPQPARGVPNGNLAEHGSHSLRHAQPGAQLGMRRGSNWCFPVTADACEAFRVATCCLAPRATGHSRAPHSHRYPFHLTRTPPSLNPPPPPPLDRLCVDLAERCNPCTCRLPPSRPPPLSLSPILPPKSFLDDAWQSRVPLDTRDGLSSGGPGGQPQAIS